MASLSDSNSPRSLWLRCPIQTVQEVFAEDEGIVILRNLCNYLEKTSWLVYLTVASHTIIPVPSLLPPAITTPNPTSTSRFMPRAQAFSGKYCTKNI